MSVNNSKPFQHRAVAAGVTKALIRDVIHDFYGKVRQDVMLGPIFENAIGGNWDRHIEKVILFWTTATRLDTGYKARNFMPAHMRHASIGTEQLSRWLSLFQETLAERCAPDTSDVLFEIAERMAENIRVGLSNRDAQLPRA